MTIRVRLIRNGTYGATTANEGAPVSARQRAAKRCRTPVLLAALAGLAPVARALEPTAAGTPTPVSEAPTEEVVVVGAHEGPRLWSVRKGDHVLWILGTVSPLPKRMIWQSDAVQTLLQETQEVVPGWPAFGIGANPFTALRLYIQWRRIQKIGRAHV